MRLEFDGNAFDDLKYWVHGDRKKALKILELIEEISRDPFKGTGKPEPLRYALSGCWSRRIDLEHRIVYQIQKEGIRFLSFRYHY